MHTKHRLSLMSEKSAWCLIAYNAGSRTSFIKNEEGKAHQQQLHNINTIWYSITPIHQRQRGWEGESCKIIRLKMNWWNMCSVQLEAYCHAAHAVYSMCSIHLAWLNKLERQDVADLHLLLLNKSWWCEHLLKLPLSISWRLASHFFILLYFFS